MDKSPILASLESALDTPIVVASTGSIASGKSTFLSALHAVLGYDSRGIKIDKDALRGRSRAQNKANVHKRMDKGILRTNATIRPDSMPVYGVIDDKVYAFQFYAPGGHLHAVKLKENPDGLLYFVDLELAQLCGEPLDTEKTLRWSGQDVRLSVPDGNVIGAVEKFLRRMIEYNLFEPERTEQNRFDAMKIALGIEDAGIGTVKDLAEYLASTAVKDMPMFGLHAEIFKDRNGSMCYAGELAGAVMQSIIDSHQYAESQSGEGIPVIGVGTHRSVVYDQLPRDREGLLRAVQDNFNRAIAKYREYQAEHSIQTGDFAMDLVSGLAIDWHFVELLGQIKVKSKLFGDYTRPVLNTRNTKVLEIAHDIMARALQHGGIEPDGFKVVTFSKKQSALTTHYDYLRH